MDYSPYWILVIGVAYFVLKASLLDHHLPIEKSRLDLCFEWIEGKIRKVLRR
jgi:hypothetical protein